jgi:hypothetical protein
MSNKKFVSIDYTQKDFASVKTELIAYAKRYYPDTIKDFTEASFGSLLLDSVAYVGDLLSFYLDYQFNESLLATSNDYENALRLAKQLGYKYKGSPSATGKVAIYAIVPANALGLGPNSNYLPILKRNSVIGSTAGTSFILTQDVRFDDPSNEVVAARIDDTTGNVSSYAVKAFGDVISGQFETIEQTIGTFQKFRKVMISDASITEIISVFDADGNEYFEVDYLSQDLVYRPQVNVDPTTKEQTPALLIPFAVPRRFMIEKTRTGLSLVFGHGSETTLSNNPIPDPSTVVMERFGREFVTDETFDPSNLVGNDKFGIGPANTTLTIKLRKNSSLSTNVAVGQVKNVTRPILDFKNPLLVSTTVQQDILGSLECFNEEPINAGQFLPALDDIKRSALDHFATQNRAVTAQDYEALVYHLDSRFGSVKRVRTVRDPDSLKRNINLYVLSEDANGKFSLSNATTKYNIKNWLSRYKMINDTIDILDGRIVNIGIDFDIMVSEPYNKFEVLDATLLRVRTEYNRALFLGEPINVYDVYSILNRVDGVSDVINVKFTNKRTSEYSSDFLNMKRYTTTDGRKIVPPENVVFEVKFPLTDINGTVR